jgi:hypothetical protein
MADGLSIILSDPQVKSVFVNVFGGITACDAVANGILQAYELLEQRGTPVKLPIVVRLDGNNADLGTQILDASPPRCRRSIERVETMDDAARRAAELAATGQGQGPDRWRSGSPRQQGPRAGHDRLRGPQAHPAHAHAGTTSSAASRRARAGRPSSSTAHGHQPVFDSVAEAVEKTGADVSVVFVPAQGHEDAPSSRPSTPASRSSSSSPKASGATTPRTSSATPPTPGPPG